MCGQFFTPVDRESIVTIFSLLKQFYLILVSVANGALLTHQKGFLFSTRNDLLPLDKVYL